MVKQPSRPVSWLGLSLLAMSLATTAQLAVAQSYPSNTIRIVVGGPAGAPPDIITRILANELVQVENWKIVVENKPGAIWTIAGNDVLKQPADGYTVYRDPPGPSSCGRRRGGSSGTGRRTPTLQGPRR
jgi:hypothetical protein